MILPIILGFVIGRFVRKKNHVLLLGLPIGVMMGLLAGLEIAPLLYPLMIIQIPWVGVPEIRRVGLVLGYPELILFSESVHFQSYSILLASTALVVSVVGVILGLYLGLMFRGSDVESPWKANEEDE
jgi:hypothetical protein